MSGFMAIGLTIAGGAVLSALAVAAMIAAMQRGWRPLACIAAGTVVFIIAGGAFGLWASGAEGRSGWKAEFQENLDASLEVYRELGWDEKELSRAAWMVENLFLAAAPGWLIVGAVFLSVAGFLFLRRTLPHLAGARHPWPSLAAWRMPEGLIWFLLADLALILAGGRLGEWLRTPTWSVLVVLAHGYFINGLAVGVFVFRQWRAPRWLQVTALLGLALLPGALMFMILVGVLDTWWDWRRRLAGGSPHDDAPPPDPQ